MSREYIKMIEYGKFFPRWTGYYKLKDNTYIREFLFDWNDIYVKNSSLIGGLYPFVFDQPKYVIPSISMAGMKSRIRTVTKYSVNYITKSEYDKIMKQVFIQEL
jgi:hypothetical protein